MKRIFVNLFCVAFFSFVLFGCFFVPENFEMTAQFNKNKTYIIKYEGMLAFTPYLSEKIKRQNDPKFTEQIKISDEKNIKYGKEVMDKNKSIKKMDYKGNGRYDTLIILEGNIDENTDFFTGRKQVSLFDIPIFTQLDNGNIQFISIKDPKQSDLDGLAKLGIKLSGTVFLKTEGKILEHNATKTPGLFSNSYEWEIGEGKPMPKAIISLE